MASKFSCIFWNLPNLLFNFFLFEIKCVKDNNLWYNWMFLKQNCISINNLEEFLKLLVLLQRKFSLFFNHFTRWGNLRNFHRKIKKKKSEKTPTRSIHKHSKKFKKIEKKTQKNPRKNSKKLRRNHLFDHIRINLYQNYWKLENSSRFLKPEHD